MQHWKAQGEFGGAEHHVYYDETTGRWFKRLYAGINESTDGPSPPRAASAAPHSTFDLLLLPPADPAPTPSPLGQAIQQLRSELHFSAYLKVPA